MARDMEHEELIEHLFHDWDNPAWQTMRAERRKSTLTEAWGEGYIAG